MRFSIHVMNLADILIHEARNLMLDANNMNAASDLLYEKWQSLQRINQLPFSMRPNSRPESYAVQALLERHSQFPLFGWKIAATSLAGQTHIGVKGPMAGRILREKVIDPDDEVSLDSNLMRVAEVEFAFKIGQDLPPRSKPYSMEEVLDAVISLHPAIEIPDSRYNDFVTVGECQLIADNACAHLFILGESTKFQWRQLDLAAYVVDIKHVRAGHVIKHSGLGANVLGDPRIALTWIANELSSIDVTLKQDQVVTTGTCLTPIQVLPGDRVEADFGALGRIGAGFK
jgi:2-keto-4-pentenoate hydratase